jgi:hypothetical protein
MSQTVPITITAFTNGGTFAQTAQQTATAVTTMNTARKLNWNLRFMIAF